MKLNLENLKKKLENIFPFSDKWFWKCCNQFALVKKRKLVIGSQWVKKHWQDFGYLSEIVFRPELPSQGSIIMAMVLSFSFEQPFVLFIKLVVKESPETGLFRQLPKQVFEGPYV